MTAMTLQYKTLGTRLQWRAVWWITSNYGAPGDLHTTRKTPSNFFEIPARCCINGLANPDEKQNSAAADRDLNLHIWSRWVSTKLAGQQVFVKNKAHTPYDILTPPD